MSNVRRLRDAPVFLDDLAARGLLTPEESARLARLQAENGETAVRALEKLGFIDARSLAIEVSRHFAIALVEEHEWPASLPLADRISPRFMRDHRILPL